jgi:hypothetical protein
MKQFWMSVTVICIAGAAAAFGLDHYDAAFVIATIGALSWFLNYRVSAKNVIKEADQEDEHEESSGSLD